MPNNTIVEIIGGAETQIVVGVGAFATLNGLSAYAFTVRSQGTVIAACTFLNAPAGYVPTWMGGVVLNQGDYIVSYYRITNITLTAAADSVALHCD